MRADAIGCIDDCHQPSIIAAAVHSGHQAGRELAGGVPALPRRGRVVQVV